MTRTGNSLTQASTGYCEQRACGCYRSRRDARQKNGKENRCGESSLREVPSSSDQSRLLERQFMTCTTDDDYGYHFHLISVLWLINEWAMTIFAVLRFRYPGLGHPWVGPHLHSNPNSGSKWWFHFRWSFQLLLLLVCFFNVSTGQKKQKSQKKGFCPSEHCSPCLVFLFALNYELEKPQKH